jgi:hypothetical protein
MIEAGQYSVRTASGNIKTSQGVLFGVFCSTSTAGTIALYDDAATGTSIPMTGTITLVAGTLYRIPVGFANGLNAVIGGTANVTVIYL